MNRRTYCNFAIYKDQNTRIRFHGGHIEIMLLIEIETLELMGNNDEIMLIIEIETLEFDSTAAIMKLCYL